MDLQNIISAETLRELLSQARKAGWEHLIYPYGFNAQNKGQTDWHQHVWRRGQVQISFDMGRIDIQDLNHSATTHAWSFPAELLDMDGLTLVLSVALSQIGGPGFDVPDLPTKSTDCYGGCCYNALKDECVDRDCDCHAVNAGDRIGAA